MIDTVQAFQLGTSTVITLPKRLGIKPGQKLKIQKSRGNIVLEEEKMNKVDVSKLVKRLSGGLKLKKDLTPEELDKLFEESYG